MRMMLSASMAVESFNRAVLDGSAATKMMKILQALKPEAAYFVARNGERTAILIVDVSDASQVPSIVEPFMLTFNAKVELQPVMVPQDLQQAGFDEIGKAWG
jgi:hypothetical protein